MIVEDLLFAIFCVEILHLVLMWYRLSKCLPYEHDGEKPCEKYNWWNFS